MITAAILTALPYAVPLITGLVKQAQEHFGHDNGTGPVKLQTVAESALPYLQKLATAGKIGALDLEQVIPLVETVVQMLKAFGVLPGTAGVNAPVPVSPVAAAPTQTVFTIGKRYTFQLIEVEG